MNEQSEKSLSDVLVEGIVARIERGFDPPRTAAPSTTRAVRVGVEATLEAVAQSGYVVIERDRAERLRCAGASYWAWWRSERGCSDRCAAENTGLVRSDLDPIGGEQ